MRLIIDVRPQKRLSMKYPREYIRNFIYSALKNTDFNKVHDERYKHFNYSNIFPYTRGMDYYKPSKIYKIIFSTPNEKLLKLISQKLIEKQLIIGNVKLEVKNMKFLNPLSKIEKVVTATPIVVRIPQHLYEDYDIKSNKEYVFWKEDEFLNTFYEAILKNGIRRFNHYKQKQNNITDTVLSEENLPTELFKSFKFKKIVYGWDKHFTGSMWEFTINKKWSKSQFIKYLYDTGIGERNASSGSGFINVI